MNKNRPVQIWVDPGFAKKIKLMSVEEETSIIKLTGRLAREDNKEQDDVPKRRFRLDF